MQGPSSLHSQAHLAGEPGLHPSQAPPLHQGCRRRAWRSEGARCSALSSRSVWHCWGQQPLMAAGECTHRANLCSRHSPGHISTRLQVSPYHKAPQASSSLKQPGSRHTACKAHASRTNYEVLSNEALHLVRSIGKHVTGADDQKAWQTWLQLAMARPVQDLLTAANQLLKLSVAANSSKRHTKMLGKVSSTLSPVQLLAARQLLLIVENRDGALDALPQDLRQLSQLARLLAAVNQASASKAHSSLEQAEQLISARLRWPKLSAWICQQVLQQCGGFGVNTSSAALQALATAVYPAPVEVLVTLTQSLLSLHTPSKPGSAQQTGHVSYSSEEAPAQDVEPVAGGSAAPSVDSMAAKGLLQSGSSVAGNIREGLLALSQLLRLQGHSGGSAELQACLEHAAGQLGPSVGSMCPQLLAEFCQAATLARCVLPTEFTVAVVEAAIQRVSQSEDIPAQQAAAVSAALVTPYLDSSVPNKVELLQQLLSKLLTQPVVHSQHQSTGTGSGAAGAYLSSLQHVHVQDVDTGAAILQAVAASKQPELMALALHSLAGSPAVASQCQGLLESLAQGCKTMQISSLCLAAAAVRSLPPHLQALAASQALISACADHLSSSSSAPTTSTAAPQLSHMLHLIAAYHEQLHSSQPDSQGGPHLALPAVHRLADASPATPALPGLSVLAAQHEAAACTSVLPALSHAASRSSTAVACHAAVEVVLHHLTCHCAWMQPHQQLELLQAMHTHKQQAGVVVQGAAATPGAQAEHSLPVLLRVLTLALWSSSPGMSDAQLCSTVYWLGKLKCCPGLLLRQAVEYMRASLASNPLGSSQEVSDATIQDLVRLCWGLARVSQRQRAAQSWRALMVTCTQQLLSVQAQSQQDKPQTPRQVPPALASSWDSQQQLLEQHQASKQEQADVKHGIKQQVDLDSLCTVLWALATVQMVDSRQQEVVRQLVLAIMGHGGTCTLRQLSTVWWACGQVGLSGSRLTSWLLDNTTQQLSHTVAQVRQGQQHVWLGEALMKVCCGLQQQGIQADEQLHALLVQAATSSLQTMGAAELTTTVYYLHDSMKDRKSSSSSAEGCAGLQVLVGRAVQVLEQQTAQFAVTHAVWMVWVAARRGLRVSHTTLESISARLAATAVCRVKQGPEEPHSTADAGIAHVDDKLISQFMWASSVCGYMPTKLATTYGAALPERLARHYDSRRDALETADIIAAATFGLGSTHCQLDKHVLKALDTAIQRYHQFMSGSQLANSLYGMALLRHCPQQAWASGALFSQLKDVARSMGLQELVHTVWALSQWPLAQMLGPQRMAEVRAALRPVLLVHVVGSQLSAAAAASYDAAGEPQKALPTGSQAADNEGSSEPKQRRLFQDHSTGSNGNGNGMELPSATTLLSPEAVATASPNTPGIPFGRPSIPVQQEGSQNSGAAPADAQEQVSTGDGNVAAEPIMQPPQFRVGPPPLGPCGIVNLAVGVACLDIGTPDVAEAIAAWAAHELSGGLARFTSRQLVCLLWAFATCKHDRLSLFEGAAELLVQRAQQPSASTSIPVNSNGRYVARPGTGSKQLSTRDVQKLFWAWAKFNRHPGEELLQAMHEAWVQATEATPFSGSASSTAAPISGAPLSRTGHSISGSSLPPFDELCSMMYSLAILREHRHPLMLTLTQQLKQQLSQWGIYHTNTPSAVNGGSQALANLPAPVMKHAYQLAACMLGAQAEQQQSPLVDCLPVGIRNQVLDVWRRRVLARSRRRPAGYLKDLIHVATRGGYKWRVEVTNDGLVCPDLTVALPTLPQLIFSMELVGSHNTAANSGRLLGDAALKYRLLQSRGFLVVPISCKEWDKIGKYDGLSKSLYVQNKVERRLAAVTGMAAGTTQPGMPAQPGVPAAGPSTGMSTSGEAAAGSPGVDVSVRAPPTRIEVSRRAPTGIPLLPPSDSRPA